VSGRDAHSPSSPRRWGPGAFAPASRKGRSVPAFAGTTVLWLVALFVATIAYAAEGDLEPIPPLTARVTDLTGTLDAQQKQTLESELEALEQRKGAQIAVLIVATTQPEDIAQYAIRVFDQWKLGRKGIDDGALLIVAKDDHRVRIEVARGLEAAIPDAAVARIIREYITPRFRAGDFYGGIHDATGALTKLVDGEELPPPLTDERDHRRGSKDVFNALVWAFFVGLWVRAMFGRVPMVPRSGIVGAASGGVAWLVSGLVPLGIGVGVVGLVLGLIGGGGGGGFANRGGWGGWGGGGGFGGGGFGGGGGWGGGGGGGFSGGGGISAGGGASGSW
jgi:uncharacterized protein